MTRSSIGGIQKLCSGATHPSDNDRQTALTLFARVKKAVNLSNVCAKFPRKDNLGSKSMEKAASHMRPLGLSLAYKCQMEHVFLLLV